MDLGKYRKFFLIIMLGSAFLMPKLSQATGVGFIPSTGIWFSRTKFAPKETIRIYTVIINNDYFSLDGTVQFFDNEKVIDTVEIKSLSKETAKQVKIFWQPEEGSHALSARFTKVYAIDEKGNRQVIDENEINGAAGLPLQIGDRSIVSQPSKLVSQVSFSSTSNSISSLSNVLKDASQTKKEVSVSTVKVAILKSGKDLSIVPVETVNQPAETTSSTLFDEANGLWKKNHELLTRAEGLANTITSTANKINQAYVKSASLVERGEEYYGKAKQGWLKIQPQVQIAKQGWLKVTNNNEPRRLAILVGAVLFVSLAVRWRRRRRNYYDN